MLVPGGMLFLQQDSIHFLWKNIFQVKWLLQGMAPWSDPFQHTNDFTDSHTIILSPFTQRSVWKDRLNSHGPFYNVYLLKTAFGSTDNNPFVKTPRRSWKSPTNALLRKRKKKIYHSLQPLQKMNFSVLTELSGTWNLRLDISPQAKAYIYRTCTIIRLYLKCKDSIQ